MPDPLQLLAFAAPDGAEAGLALGDGRLALPAEAESRFAALESPRGHGVLSAGELDGIGVVAGPVARPQPGESLRVAVAVFPDRRALALAALRPKRARGHDRDEIDALVSEAGEPRDVDDPRMSVTLDGNGVPLRVGLELWLAPPEGDGDDPPAPDYPRRAAGEVGEPALSLSSDGLHALAHPVRWRSRGEAGFGWFLIAESA